MLITQEYKQLNAELHGRTDYGTSGHKWAATIAELACKLGTLDILDYGCGKQTLQKSLGIPIKQYDPCLEGFDATPEPADIVMCGDVLEHIEPDCLDDVLDDLQRVVKRAGVFVVSTRPARRILADGRNAHLIQEPYAWWKEKIEARFDILRAIESEHSFFVFVGKKAAEPVKEQA